MKHIVGFSGGIDSQACARWVLNRYPAEDVILTNSDAGGWEDPLTTGFIDWYSANVHPVVKTNAIIADMWKTPGFAETKGLDGSAVLTFEAMVRIKGRPPSRKAQFCTEKLKLEPQRRWLNATFGPGGGGYMKAWRIAVTPEFAGTNQKPERTRRLRRGMTGSTAIYTRLSQTGPNKCASTTFKATARPSTRFTRSALIASGVRLASTAGKRTY